MTGDKDKTPSASDELRRRAEEELHVTLPAENLARMDTETQRLFHELQVHQIELELQNGELLQARDEIESHLKKYTDLYDFAPVGYCTLDRDGTVRVANLSAATLLGREHSRLLGWRFALGVAEEERPLFAVFLDKVLASPGKASCEVTLRPEDGRLRHVQIEAVAAASGQECRLAIIDMTPRKQAEEALRESEERFRATFDQAAVGIGLVGPDGSILRINQKYCDIVGYSEAELKTMTIQELTHPDDLEASMEQFQKMLAGKLGSYNLEKRYLRKDGAIVCVELTVSTVVDADGKLRFAVGVVEDITTRKRAEAEIERLNSDLATRATEMEAFNYTVAHDLRKPLTVINGYCQALREFCSEKFDEACHGYLREAYDGTLRMNRLIDALLDFSRLGHVEPHREMVDLSALTYAVAAELKLAEAGRKVTLLIADGVSATGDAALLRVVLDNLLGNAWKYTGTRDEAVIEFGAKVIDGKPAYFVRDNGAGFDNADADKIFRPFQRLPGAEECRGFGIGLATVERIIRRHGGKVWAEGEPGKGAIFCFTLQAPEGGSRNDE